MHGATIKILHMFSQYWRLKNKDTKYVFTILKAEENTNAVKINVNWFLSDTCGNSWILGRFVLFLSVISSCDVIHRGKESNVSNNNFRVSWIYINSQLDATTTHFIDNYNQLSKFGAIISLILRSTRLYLHRQCCLQAASSVHYTTSCKHSLVLLRMGEIIARNMLSWL